MQGLRQEPYPEAGAEGLSIGEISVVFFTVLQCAIGHTGDHDNEGGPGKSPVHVLIQQKQQQRKDNHSSSGKHSEGKSIGN